LVLDIIVGYTVGFVDYLLIARQILNLHNLTHPRFPVVMNYHCGIAHDSTCNRNFSLNLSIT
jgi:hypothetical protein